MSTNADVRLLPAPASVSLLLNPPQQSLLSYVDRSQSNCLNESAEHRLESIVQPHKSSASYLLSDVDEQLLLNVSVSFVLILYRVQEPSQVMLVVPPNGQNKGSEGTQ
jgi:TFIIF-interacting CTD phosphatase-like protein